MSQVQFRVMTNGEVYWIESRRRWPVFGWGDWYPQEPCGPTAGVVTYRSLDDATYRIHVLRHGVKEAWREQAPRDEPWMPQGYTPTHDGPKVPPTEPTAVRRIAP